MSEQTKIIPRGRGASINPTGRFEHVELVMDEAPIPDEDGEIELNPQIKTRVYKDSSRSIIAYNDSPDVGFTASMNVYRGCEHGCIYCYARPTHEYFGLSAGLDFETVLFAKTDAPALLREALAAKKWQPQPVVMSGVTDCYQPVERKLGLTRECLKVFAEFRNPVGIITKNHLVTRDIDVLGELAAHHAARVFVSITTLDGELARAMEPRASAPQRRLQAVRELKKAGIPVGVMMAPVIPGLTDHEIPALLEAAAEAGAEWAGKTILRLPYGVKDLFDHWLAERFPLKHQKILHRIREVRGGKLNDAEFGSRMRGQGLYADMIHDLFAQSRKRFGLDKPLGEMSTAAFRNAGDKQLALF